MKSDAIILNEAMAALGTRLNPVEIEKFIVLVNRNGFDYQQWRTRLWQEETLESLSRKAQTYYENKPSV
jgi:hypothetical protein